MMLVYQPVLGILYIISHLTPILLVSNSSWMPLRTPQYLRNQGTQRIDMRRLSGSPDVTLAPSSSSQEPLPCHTDHAHAHRCTL